MVAQTHRTSNWYFSLAPRGLSSSTALVNALSTHICTAQTRPGWSEHRALLQYRKLIIITVKQELDWQFLGEILSNTTRNRREQGSSSKEEKHPYNKVFWCSDNSKAKAKNSEAWESTGVLWTPCFWEKMLFCLLRRTPWQPILKSQWLPAYSKSKFCLSHLVKTKLK